MSGPSTAAFTIRAGNAAAPAASAMPASSRQGSSLDRPTPTRRRIRASAAAFIASVASSETSTAPCSPNADMKAPIRPAMTSSLSTPSANMKRVAAYTRSTASVCSTDDARASDQTMKIGTLAR